MKFKLIKFIPISTALIIVSLIGIIKTYLETGDIFLRDIDLKGGASINLIFNISINLEELEEILKQKIETFILSSSKTSEGYTSIKILTEKNVEPREIIDLLNKNNFYTIEYSIHFVGPELGEVFFSQIVSLLIIAYFLLFLVNIFLYKKPIVGVTIILSSLLNIISVFGIMNLLGQKISFPGFSSMLMLIAFAIDTNIILATKVLSSPLEEFYEQYKKALITGLTINANLVISMLIVLSVSNSPFLTNIAQIQVIGFLADIVNTWILNAAIIEVVLIGKKH